MEITIIHDADEERDATTAAPVTSRQAELSSSTEATTQRTTKVDGKFLRNLVAASHHDNESSRLDALRWVGRPDLLQEHDDTAAASIPDYVAPQLAGWAHCVWTDPQTNARLYLGPATAAGPLARGALLDAHVGGIVNCTPRYPAHHRSQGMAYCQVAVNDTPAAHILPHFPAATLFLHAHLTMHGNAVLVHCMAGVSRSTTVVLAYLMEYQWEWFQRQEQQPQEQGSSQATFVSHRRRRCLLHQVYHHVKRRRPQVHPNDGFWVQLETYEKQLAIQRRKQDQHAPARLSVPLLSDHLQPVDDQEWLTKWIRQSNAIYAGCRDLPVMSSPAATSRPASTTTEECSPTWLRDVCFDPLVSHIRRRHPQLPLKKDDETSLTNAKALATTTTTRTTSWREDKTHILATALDFVWGRGLVDVEVTWLAHLGQVLDELAQPATTDNPQLLDTHSIVEQLLTNAEASIFLERWAGEVYPRQVGKIFDALQCLPMEENITN